jgi:hypothetical protein
MLFALFEPAIAGCLGQVGQAGRISFPWFSLLLRKLLCVYQPAGRLLMKGGTVGYLGQVGRAGLVSFWCIVFVSLVLVALVESGTAGYLGQVGRLSQYFSCGSKCSWQPECRLMNI